MASSHRAQIIEVIERRLGDPALTPSSIAGELRMTPSYLHRVFAGDRAETVGQYILRRRLEESAEALKDPLQARRSITSIAFGLGFNSLSHFCRAFRERYASTPRDYR
jgi:AraC-like DNA-binding protein